MTEDVEQAEAAPENGAMAEIIEIVKTVAYALMIALFLRVIFFQPFTIPSASMEPTLLEGDYLIVSKYSYGYSHHSIPFSPPIFHGRLFEQVPKRGDIIVFKLPRDGHTDYIKRLIGLPGDRIDVNGGVLTINGKEVPRRPLPPVMMDSGYGFTRNVERYEESMDNGRKYITYDFGPDGPEDTKGPHLHWCSAYKQAHLDEWLAFKSAWEAEHPKGSRATSQANSDGESAEGEAAEGAKPKKRGAKKMSEMTPEELAVAKAKRAANKAAKAAAKAASEDEEAENFAMAPAAAVGGASAPAAAAAAAEEAEDELELEEEEESLDKLIPFTHKKIKYLRYGHLDEDGEGVWWEGGDIWLQKEDGSKGAYAGQIQASGKIDISAEVMAAEPNIE